MDSIFCLKDPLGNKVILTKSCWEKHISIFHPIMKTKLDKIKGCIEDPDCIFESKRSKDSFLYFKDYSNLAYGNNYVMVAVCRKTGYVQSSYPVYNLNKGGNLIWEKK